MSAGLIIANRGGGFNARIEHAWAEEAWIRLGERSCGRRCGHETQLPYAGGGTCASCGGRERLRVAAVSWRWWVACFVSAIGNGFGWPSYAGERVVQVFCVRHVRIGTTQRTVFSGNEEKIRKKCKKVEKGYLQTGRCVVLYLLQASSALQSERGMGH